MKTRFLAALAGVSVHVVVMQGGVGRDLSYTIPTKKRTSVSSFAMYDISNITRTAK